MNTKKQLICIELLKEIANYANANTINYTVLSGYDPCTGAIGRDIDLYAPSKSDAVNLAREFYRILKKYKFPWVLVVDPIWGYRCIGVNSDFLYFELHIITNVRVTCLPVSRIFKLTPLKSNIGVKYDPLYMIFKQIFIKENRKILSGQPFMLLDSAKSLLEKYFDILSISIGPGLIQSLIDNDRTSIEMRKNHFIKFISNSYKRPFESIFLVLKGWAEKNIFIYTSPCVPTFTLLHNINNAQIDCLCKLIKSRLSCIFLEIIIINAEKKITKIKSLKLQARQCLIIILCNNEIEQYIKTDYKLYLNLDKSTEFVFSADNICRSIINNFINFNEKWKCKYQI